MPTPLPPKGTVLQTAEFADSLYSPVLVAFVSCVSSTFFQPARSGSHLYSAHRNTVRSGHQVMVLHTLVGIRHLRGCLTLAFCTCIIAHIRLLVKYFFEKSQFYFLGFRLHLLLSRSVLLAKTLVEELGNTPWNRTFEEASFRTLCTFSIAHWVGFVKRFFELFRSVGRFCFTSPNYALGRGCSLLSAS